MEGWLGFWVSTIPGTLAAEIEFAPPPVHTSQTQGRPCLAANLATAARADPDLHPSPAVPAGQQSVTLRTVRSCPEKSPRSADCKGCKAAGDRRDDNPKRCAEFASHRWPLLRLRADYRTSFQAANNYRSWLSAGQTVARGMSRARDEADALRPAQCGDILGLKVIRAEGGIASRNEPRQQAC